MRKRLSILTLLACVAVSRAADVPALIQSTDAAALAAHEGENVVVTGVVTAAEWSKSGKVMTIEFDRDTKFTAAVFEANRAKLDAAFNDDLAKTLTGAVVRFSGRLIKYGGRDPKLANAYQMTISMSHNITVLPPTTQTAAARTGRPR